MQVLLLGRDKWTLESYPEEGERKLSGDKCSLKGDLKDLKVFPNGGNGNHTKFREHDGCIG